MTVTGSVSDASAAILPDVIVRVKNLDTGVTVQTSTVDIRMTVGMTTLAIDVTAGQVPTDYAYSQDFALNEAHIFGPSTINEIRLMYMRDRQLRTENAAALSALQGQGPFFTVQGLTAPYVNQSAAAHYTQQWSATSNFKSGGTCCCRSATTV